MWEGRSTSYTGDTQAFLDLFAEKMVPLIKNIGLEVFYNQVGCAKTEIMTASISTSPRATINPFPI